MNLALIIASIACPLLVVTVGGWALVIYNRLVRQRNQVAASWAQIDVQLTRRHELIPQLVDTVAGYASHERATLEAVAVARTSAIHTTATDAAARSRAEGQLTQTLGGLFALAEGYPQLRANQHFAELQAELATTENKIAYARQFYNSAVQTLTNTVQSVPSNLVASGFGFRAPDYFEAIGEERGSTQVSA